MHGMLLLCTNWKVCFLSLVLKPCLWGAVRRTDRVKHSTNFNLLIQVTNMTSNKTPDDLFSDDVFNSNDKILKVGISDWSKPSTHLHAGLLIYWRAVVTFSNAEVPIPTKHWNTAATELFVCTTRRGIRDRTFFIGCSRRIESNASRPAEQN